MNHHLTMNPLAPGGSLGFGTDQRVQTPPGFRQGLGILLTNMMCELITSAV